MNDTFEALYHAERLHMVNPAGDVGIVTLWSPLRSARRRLAEISAELLDPARSRVAVISNLYGDGMYAMLCNLLYNPQVRHLIAIGQDLGLPTCEELEAFLEHGLEDATMLGASVKRIRGTDRVFPAGTGFDERRLRERLSFAYLGKLSSESLPSELLGRLDGLPRELGNSHDERLRVTIEEAPDTGLRRPSQPAAHQVVRRRPLDCWEELVVRAVRFGRPVTLSNGPRLELLNAKAVITEPARESEQALERYGFQLQSLLDYEAKMLEAELPEDTSYTYGNRMRKHFQGHSGPIDTLSAAIDRLRANPETRHAYVSLWDNAVDLAGERNGEAGDSTGATQGPSEGAGSPCLTTLFFRGVGDELSLSATFRAHNLLTAWLRNVYGLMAIQRHVAERCGMEIGSIAVVSHSLGIDPMSPRFGVARSLSEGWRRDDDRDHETGKYSLREDPHGYFVVSVDERERRIVVEHRFGGVLVKRYTGRHADALANEIGGDMAVGLVSHALWLGRELARNETILNGMAGRA
ncbi:MAG: thymidylate synthase [Solirubrobacteraceae bacterium]